MNLKRHVKETPDINITPLIDVVFLLLIFLLVSTTFKKDNEIAINLPESSPTFKKSQLAIGLEIIINPTGMTRIKKIYTAKAAANLRGKSEVFDVVHLNVKGLKRAIKKISGGDRNTKIAIRADAKSPHQSFIRVVDSLMQLGFKNFSILTQPPEK